MEHCLLLNASYEPINIVSWKRALTLLFQDKVEVIAEHDREVRSVSFAIRLPSVMRLLRYVKIKRRHRRVKFSRESIYARDDFTCQYCGSRHHADRLTFDHVIPVVKGGTRAWDNIVTCCIECNHKKGGRTPAEAGMRLIRTPREPGWAPSMLHVTVGFKLPPQSWRDFLFLNANLDRSISFKE